MQSPGAFCTSRKPPAHQKRKRRQRWGLCRTYGAQANAQAAHNHIDRFFQLRLIPPKRLCSFLGSDDMPDGCNGTDGGSSLGRQTAIASRDFCAHIRFVAMHPAVGTEGFGLHKRALVRCASWHRRSSAAHSGQRPPLVWCYLRQYRAIISDTIRFSRSRLSAVLFISSSSRAPRE